MYILMLFKLPTICEACARRQLPEDQCKCIDVNPEVSLSLETDGSFENLGSHVATGTHLWVGLGEDGDRERESEGDRKVLKYVYIGFAQYCNNSILHELVCPKSALSIM